MATDFVPQVAQRRPTQTQKADKRPAFWSPGRKLSISLGAVGTVSALVAAGTGLVALDSVLTIKASCPDYPTCPIERRPSASGLRDRANSYAGISTASAGTAALLVLTATLLWVALPPKRSARIERLELTF